MKIIGNNTAGLAGKTDSLIRVIEVFNAAVIMLQETKFQKEGKFSLKGYRVFENIRNQKGGGGLMTIVHQNLESVKVPDENCEFLIVDIEGSFGSMRLINCYGPQENLSVEIRTQFFIDLETRIIRARNSDKLICIELDANSKLGSSHVAGDSREMSSNGKLFADLIERQDLVVVNSTDLCFGTITRVRNTKSRTEESVLDYFVVCQELYENVVKMVIDEQRKYVLTKFYKCKGKTSVIESDHNLLFLFLSLKFKHKITPQRLVSYALKDPDSLEQFKINTSENVNFGRALQSENISRGGYLWLKELKHVIATSFQKIRISASKTRLPSQYKFLFEEREMLKNLLSNCVVTNSKSAEIKEKIQLIDEKIADLKAKENFERLSENVKHLMDNTDNLNTIKMWQLRKKFSKKKTDVPTAKKNEKGELITAPSQLLRLYEATYRERLRHRLIRPELSEMYKRKMKLFELRLKVCKNMKSKSWSKQDLLKVLSSLKTKKSADSHGLIYELFRPENIGNQLLESLLMLCNQVKDQQTIPSFFMLTDITSIYKGKGPKCDLNSDRGIFSVSKIRSIIEKLICQSQYDTIDKSMSDSNVGGRKDRNIRDNLFVLYAIINDAIRKKKSINLQFFDISKCFDAMWTEDTMNDFYDAGVTDDNFSLISLLNDKCKVKVKTPVGDTERFELNQIEMQGTVLAPLKCSVQMDTLGKYCYELNTGLYKYKGSCNVPPLGMIDDIAGVSDCNEKSVILNAIINAKIESKQGRQWSSTKLRPHY